MDMKVRASITSTGCVRFVSADHRLFRGLKSFSLDRKFIEVGEGVTALEPPWDGPATEMRQVPAHWRVRLGYAGDIDYPASIVIDPLSMTTEELSGLVATIAPVLSLEGLDWTGDHQGRSMSEYFRPVTCHGGVLCHVYLGADSEGVGIAGLRAKRAYKFAGEK
jgi:hypothetical protein